MLTYPEIEAIIGGPLSDDRPVSGAIWVGSTIYVQRWRALGWSARIDRAQPCVIFTQSEGWGMATKYQPLVDYIAAETEGAVTLSFAEIEAILGRPLPETMQIEAAHWRHSRTALGWGLHARGWTARWIGEPLRRLHAERGVSDVIRARAVRAAIESLFDLA